MRRGEGGGGENLVSEDISRKIISDLYFLAEDFWLENDWILKYISFS